MENANVRKQIFLRAYFSRMQERKEAECDGLIKLFLDTKDVSDRDRKSFHAGHDVAMVYALDFLRAYFFLTPRETPEPLGTKSPLEVAQQPGSPVPPKVN